MLKTIKEIAEELKVSKTAIRKYMTDDFRANYVQTDDNGVIRITANGCEILAEIIENNRKPIAETTANTDNKYFEMLIETLQKQLDAKDEQIAELTTLLNQEQQLHLHTQKQLQLLEAPTPEEATEQEKKKGGFFSRWKKN